MVERGAKTADIEFSPEPRKRSLATPLAHGGEVGIRTNVSRAP